jgi:hypothetical protein
LFHFGTKKTNTRQIQVAAATLPGSGLLANETRQLEAHRKPNRGWKSPAGFPAPV